MLTLLAPLTSTAQTSNWAPPRTVYIPQTGQSIDGVFLDFWRANNGIANYGYPITPELEENGHIVQYYEYARFEYWPEDANGEVVKLGKIGLELRPHVVVRSTSAVAGAVPGDGTSLETARMARAWLPLDSKAAKKPNTDTWRYVPETQHSVQFGFKALWEATGEAKYLGNPLTEEYILSGVTYQIFERGALAWQAGKDPWFVALGEQLVKRYNLDTSPQPQGNIPTYDEALFIEPEPEPEPEPVNQTIRANGGEIWLEINLSSQYMTVWQGNTVISGAYVSTGRPGFDTPPGTFFINTKVDVQDMEGVIGGEYYNVSSVPWVMYFTDVGHAIHGAYWHGNFGAVMSHGCVNLPVDYAAWLYSISSIGTRVEIHY